MADRMTEEGERWRTMTTFSHPAAGGDDVELAYRQNEARLLQFLRIRLKSDAEAEDAAQQTFLRLWQRRDTISTENLTALLFVTARNIACDRLRYRRRSEARHVPNEDGWALAEAVANPEANAERMLIARHDVALVTRLIQELPEKCRSAFVGYHFHFEAYNQIAARLGVTESMVRKYVQKAVSYCASRFDELEDWE